jgi:hypothetical protein
MCGHCGYKLNGDAARVCGVYARPPAGGKGKGKEGKVDKGKGKGSRFGSSGWRNYRQNWWCNICMAIGIGERIATIVACPKRSVNG